MTREEFAVNTKTLEEFYNKDFNYTQSNIWYDELKDFSSSRYEKAIKKCCKTLQYKPTLNQMLEIIVTIRENTQTAEKVDCELCHGTGYVIYHKMVNGIDYEFGAQCNCANGKGKDYDGTKIADKERRSKYYLEKVENVFLGKGA